MQNTFAVSAGSPAIRIAFPVVPLFEHGSIDRLLPPLTSQFQLQRLKRHAIRVNRTFKSLSGLLYIPGGAGCARIVGIISLWRA